MPDRLVNIKITTYFEDFLKSIFLTSEGYDEWCKIQNVSTGQDQTPTTYSYIKKSIKNFIPASQTNNVRTKLKPLQAEFKHIVNKLDILE